MVSASRSKSSSTQRRGSGNSSNSSSSLSKTHSSALYDRNGVSMGSSGRGMPRSRSDPMTSARGSQSSSTTSDAPRSNSTDAHVGLSLDGPDTEKRGSSSAGSTAVDMHSVANVSSTMPSRKDRPGRPSPTSVTSHHLSLDDHEDEALLVKAKETSTAPSDVGDKALLLREEALVELNKDDDDDALLVEHKADDVEDVARRRSESNANSGEKVLMPISDKSETEDAACLDADEVETAEAPDVVGGVSTAGDVSLKGKTEEEDGGGDLLSPGTAAATATSLSTLVPPPPPPQPYCLPPKSEWPDFPVLLRMSPDAKARVWVNGKKVPWQGALPINDPNSVIEFETAAFAGKALVRIAELPSSSPDFFHSGQKRRMQVVVQGRFKRPLRFDQVFGGQEFSKPLASMPAKRLVKFIFGLLRSRLPDVIVADLFGPQPYFYSPLVTGSKTVRVDALALNSQDASARGDSFFEGALPLPPALDGALYEEFRHHGGIHYVPAAARASEPKSPGANHSKGTSSKKAAKAQAKAEKVAQKRAASDRKAAEKALEKANAEGWAERNKRLCSIDALARHTYDPSRTYTFEYWDMNFNAATLKTDLGGVAKLDLGHIAGEQPILIDFAKTTDTGEYLYKFEIWHEKNLSASSPAWA